MSPVSIPLPFFLAVAAVLFAIGIYTVLAQRSAVMILMGIELMFTAIVLNAIAFWRFVTPLDYSPQIFAILIITVSTIEMAVGLAIMMLAYRNKRSVNMDEFEEVHET